MNDSICPRCQAAIRTARAALDVLDSDASYEELRIAAEELSIADDHFRPARRRLRVEVMSDGPPPNPAIGGNAVVRAELWFPTEEDDGYPEDVGDTLGCLVEELMDWAATRRLTSHEIVDLIDSTVRDWKTRR